jgi:hypothetical protein
MHWKTFDREAEKAEIAVEQCLAAAKIKFPECADFWYKTTR